MEWDNIREAAQQETQTQNQNQNQRGGENDNNNVVNGVMYVKVMTDEQLETLRKQIAVYATICEQLVEMHKSLSAHQDLAAAGLFTLSLFFCYFFSLIWRINAAAFTFSLFQFCLSPVCEKFKLNKLILEHLDFVCFSNSLKHVIFIYKRMRRRRRSLLINYFIHNR